MTELIKEGDVASLNRVFLMGNLTRDPELRYLASGTAVANLGLAVNRRYRTQTGELKEEVCFIGVVVWGKQAENCSQYLNKGRAIFVEGRLQSRSWETEDGQKRSIMEVRADRVQFLNRPLGREETPGETGSPLPEGETVEKENSQTADKGSPKDLSKDSSKDSPEEAPF